MKKEQIKNIVLALLVVTNLVLGSEILLDKKLWPSGYNFFSSEYFPVMRVFSKKSDKSTLERAEHLTVPEQMIFNTGDQTTRFSLNSHNSAYKSVLDGCDEILIAAMSCTEERIQEVQEEEWFSALKTKSVYLGYYTEYETELFANFMGLSGTPLSQKVRTFSNVVIGLSDNVSVYFEDIAGEKYYRVKTGRRFEKFKETAEKVIEVQTAENITGNAINYSFDLNFDKAFGTQKAIIASMVPIYQNERQLSVATAENALFENGKPDNGAIKKIVHLFGVNSNVARRYTEADGTVVYVENNATLKIYTDGLLEYKAREGGIALDGSAGGYRISKLNEFVSAVNEEGGASGDIYISSRVYEGAKYITFDYICNGLTVRQKKPGMENAVFCVLTDGYISEYRHFLRKYGETDEYTVMPEYITAVDDTIQEYSAVTGQVTINKLYPAYSDDGGAGTMEAKWQTDVEAVVAGAEVE